MIYVIFNLSFSHIFTFLLLFPPSYGFKFPSGITFSSKTSIHIFYSVSLSALIYIYLIISLFLPHFFSFLSSFLKDFYTGYAILSWLIFSLIFKYVILFSSGMFLWGVTCYLYQLSPVCCLLDFFTWMPLRLISFFFFLFMAAPAAYGNPQAKGWIRAAADTYVTATETPDLNITCDLHHPLQHQILNPLSKPGIEPTSSKR